MVCAPQPFNRWPSGEVGGVSRWHRRRKGGCCCCFWLILVVFATSRLLLSSLLLLVGLNYPAISCDSATSASLKTRTKQRCSFPSICHHLWLHFVSSSTVPLAHYLVCFASRRNKTGNGFLAKTNDELRDALSTWCHAVGFRLGSVWFCLVRSDSIDSNGRVACVDQLNRLKLTLGASFLAIENSHLLRSQNFELVFSDAAN